MSDSDKGALDDLHLGQDLRFERRWWVVQRVAWVTMALFVTAGVLGLFGKGVLSQARAAQAGNALSVEYEHFGRYGAESEFKLQIEPAGIRGGVARVLLAGGLLECMKIRSITPRTESVEVRPDGALMVFQAPDTSNPIRVSVTMMPKHIGQCTGILSLEGEPALDVSQLVYP